MGDAPGGDLSRSSDFLTDEGIWAVGALRWALTGHWHLTDAYNPNVATPVFMLYQYSLFKTFGIQLKTLRYGSLLCAIVIIGLLYLLLRREGKQTALLAACIATINFPLIIFNRLAFIENLLLCFLLMASIVLLEWMQHRRLVFGCVFWFILFVGYFTKASVLFFIPVFLTMIWWHKGGKKLQWLYLSGFIIFVLFLIAYFLWISYYLDDWRYFQQLNFFGRFLFHPRDIVLNYLSFFGHLKLFEFMPITYLIGLYMLLRTGYALYKRQNVSIIQMLMAAWLFWGMVYLGFFAYSPPRYHTLLILPIISLSSIFFNEGFRDEKPQSALSILVILPIVLSAQCLFAIYRMSVHHHFYLSCFFPWLGWVVLFILWRLEQGRCNPVTAAEVLVVMIIVLQSVQIVRYHASMEYSLHNAMRQVVAIIEKDRKKGVVLIGDSAPLFAVEAAVPVIDIMYRQETLPKVVEKLKPRYMLLENVAELNRLKQQIPDYFDDARPLISFPLMNNYAHGSDAVLFYLPHQSP